MKERERERERRRRRERERERDRERERERKRERERANAPQFKLNEERPNHSMQTTYRSVGQPGTNDRSLSYLSCVESDERTERERERENGRVPTQTTLRTTVQGPRKRSRGC
jgi:hypothetical protein